MARLFLNHLFYEFRLYDGIIQSLTETTQTLDIEDRESLEEEIEAQIKGYKAFRYHKLHMLSTFDARQYVSLNLVLSITVTVRHLKKFFNILIKVRETTNCFGCFIYALHSVRNTRFEISRNFISN